MLKIRHRRTKLEAFKFYFLVKYHQYVGHYLNKAINSTKLLIKRDTDVYYCQYLNKLVYLNWKGYWKSMVNDYGETAHLKIVDGGKTFILYCDYYGSRKVKEDHSSVYFKRLVQ